MVDLVVRIGAEHNREDGWKGQSLDMSEHATLQLKDGAPSFLPSSLRPEQKIRPLLGRARATGPYLIKAWRKKGAKGTEEGKRERGKEGGIVNNRAIKIRLGGIPLRARSCYALPSPLSLQ